MGATALVQLVSWLGTHAHWVRVRVRVRVRVKVRVRVRVRIRVRARVRAPWLSHSSEAGCSRARAQLKPYLVVGSGSVVRVSGQCQRPGSGLAPPKPYDSSQLMPPPPPVGSDAPRRARTASVCLSVRCMHELPGLPESRASCARSWYLSDQSDLEHGLTW